MQQVLLVPTGATTSTFKYLLSATSPCIADESIATVNVNNQPDAGTDGNTTVCESSVSSIDLFGLITGEDRRNMVWINWNRWCTVRQQAFFNGRQALLPVRLNIYFQQHLG
jgi:hypothetical protein